MSEYDPTWESLDRHAVPEWYHDAKLGIFVHWGGYSVPTWAPTDAAIGGENASPYAEWYPYYMYEEGSPTKEHHEERYGDDTEYIDFLEDWKAERWDPEAWADLFADVGAGYVVLTGEHHDGVPLWGSHYTRYTAETMGPKRDLVGDLCEAVRERDLRFAASYHANYNYYQPGFDGRFGHPDFDPGGPSGDTGEPGPEYVDFMNAKHQEIIRKYRPDMLWFDVPKADSDHANAKAVIADYYNQALDRDQAVLVNDQAATDSVGPTIDADAVAGEYYGDVLTPEYTSYDTIRREKWECCRGIGRSFGYNAAEDEDDHLSAGELIRSFVDIVSKNGNLLINVGPRADGTIPDVQRKPLVGLGDWLEIHGEAIFESRPWFVPENTEGSADVRYIRSNGDLYAIALNWPGDSIELDVLKHVDIDELSTASLLTSGGDKPILFDADGERLVVNLPERPAHDHAYVVRFDGFGAFGGKLRAHSNRVERVNASVPAEGEA